VQKILEGLKVGGISAPVRITKGWQLIKLDASTPTVVLPFEQAREQVTNKVFLSKRGNEMEKYVKRMREQAIIEWKNDEIKKAYEQGLAAENKEDATKPGDPTATRPDATKPDMAKPDATKPEATKPDVTKPATGTTPPKTTQKSSPSPR